MNKKLKILLIKPFSVTDEIQPPLGLGYLATAVRDKHDVTIIDGIKEKLTLQKFKDELEKENYDVIGIQCYTFDKHTVKEMINLSRIINKDIIIIVGGPEPSSNIKDIFNYLHADFGFKGEAEIGFPALMDNISGKKIKLEQIPSLIWKDKSKIKVNQQRFIENLDELKNPSWDLLKPDTYPPAPVFATRGCPYHCTFCAGFLISGRRIRYRSVKNFVDEIELLHKQYGINEIHIEDDNFSLKREFVIDFCNELIKRRLDITWACPNGIRLDSLDLELVKLMKKTGLYTVSVGIESGSDRILKIMKKSLSKEIIREKLNMLDKAGLDTVGFFILGYPDETIKDIDETIGFACSLPLKRASFMTFKPFPGTEASSRIMEELKNKDLKWENFALNTVAYSPRGITLKQLKFLRRKALIKFYFRPKIVIDFISSINSFNHAKYVFKRVFRWLLN